MLFALDDQQGCRWVLGENFGDRRQVVEQRHPFRSAAQPLFGGFIPHLAAETLFSCLRDVSGFRPGVTSIEMLIVVANLFGRLAAANMRSRQATLDQVVADDLEMFGVAVLRAAMQQ